MPAVRVLDALAAGRSADAAALVFEYMATTQAETHQRTPADVNELPAVLRSECRALARVYRPPGALLVAYRQEQPIGCVGLAPCPQDATAEVKRLYVRPEHRRGGVERILMGHAHRHAAQHAFTRLVLDVLPTRTDVIDFYRRLGYTNTEPFTPEPHLSMIYMQRLITPE